MKKRLRITTTTATAKTATKEEQQKAIDYIHTFFKRWKCFINKNNKTNKKKIKTNKIYKIIRTEKSILKI